ncbi:MAG: transcription elongation factor GreA [Pseudomonadota bacterium]|nr:transcription elongation factor GreA [Pseudomonadota bacterium]
MTVEGEAKLRNELTHLKTVERPSITSAIAEARQHGDLRENAEYHAAKEQQGFTEGRIQEIEAKLGDAQVIDITKINPSGKVVFGCTVTLVEEGSDQQARYKIVGEDEADIKEDKISVLSPMARAMIGKRFGDTVVVESPDGEREYEINTVEHL